jgi:signal transduction histidine kinase
MIVKKIVGRLEGSISLESEVGKGSRFGFTLPMPEFAYVNELAVMNGNLR